MNYVFLRPTDDTGTRYNTVWMGEAPTLSYFYFTQYEVRGTYAYLYYVVRGTRCEAYAEKTLGGEEGR